MTLDRLAIAVAALLGLAATASATMQAPPSAMDLTIAEGFTDPLGLHDPTPVLNWKLPSGVTRQTARRIAVERQDETGEWRPLADTGWVESDTSRLVAWPTSPLTSRDRIRWHVRFRDQDGRVSAWSDWARAEMGLLGREGDRIVVEVTIPPNTTATFVPPDGTEQSTLLPGDHEFTLRADGVR